MSRTLKVLYALDHFILALITWGRCKPYEMISSALWSLDLDGKRIGRALRPVVDFVLRPIGSDHCKNSYLWQIQIYKGAQ